MWDLDPPLQTFFFVPSFIAFVLHNSDSIVPQLQQPSVDIYLIVADVDGVGVSTVGEGFVSDSEVSGAADGGTALRRRRSIGLLANLLASSGDILPSDRRRAWSVAREGVDGGGDLRWGGGGGVVGRGGVLGRGAEIIALGMDWR